MFSLHINIYGDDTTQKTDVTQGGDSSVYYKASDVSQSDISNNLFVLSGDAEVNSDKYTICADKIIFNTKDNTLESITNKYNYTDILKRIKILSKTGDTLYCDSLKYNVNKGIGVAKNAMLYKKNTIILAKTAKINNDGRYYCSNLSLTTCKKKNPDWAIIVDKAIITKNNLFYLYGVKLMFCGVYFPLVKEIGLPYLMPETNKSGLKYPESVNFGSYGGLAVKNCGFYIYIDKNHDINCNLSVFLGNSSANLSLIHNYIKNDVCSGDVTFSLNKISLNEMLYGYEEEIETDWEFRWQHHTLSYKNYEFNAKVFLAGGDIDSSGDTDSSSGVGGKNLSIDVYFKLKNLLRYMAMDIGVNYDKNFKTKLENIEIPYFNFNIKSIQFLKYFSINPTMNACIFYSNKKKDIYKKDKHDITMKDDILGNTDVLNKSNIMNFFKNISSEKICNIFRSFSYEFKSSIPLKFGLKNFDILVNYNNRLFFSKYETGSIVLRKIPYYIHSFDVQGTMKLKMMSSKLSFDELNSKNLFKIKWIGYVNDINISLKFNPSLDKMQKLFGLEQTYINDCGKTIDLFYHTKFGNLQNNESLVVGFSSDSCLNISRLDNDKDIKKKIFNFYIKTGYDFLKTKCKLDDITANLNMNLLGLNISSSCVFYPYQYSETVNNKSEQIDKWFFDTNDSFCKSFLKSVLKFDVNVSLKLIDNKSKNIDKETKKNKINLNDKFMLNKSVSYDKFYIWENLVLEAKYTFDYKYNPVIKKDEKLHFASLTASTLLSKKCNIMINGTYNIKDKFISAFRLSGTYDLHCWSIKFEMAVTTDDKYERKIKYDISLNPKVSTFSFLSQNRGETLNVGY